MLNGPKVSGKRLSLVHYACHAIIKLSWNPHTSSKFDTLCKDLTTVTARFLVPEDVCSKQVMTQGTRWKAVYINQCEAVSTNSVATITGSLQLRARWTN